MRTNGRASRRHGRSARSATAAPDPRSTGALTDSSDRVRKQAAWALGAVDDRRAVDALVRALKDQNSGVREQAAWALGAIGDSQALPGLLPALKDANSGVRRQAAWAIGVIGK